MFINQILAKLKSLVYSKSETETLLNSKGFITSEIDSMGEGWVRFKSGLQICWGVSNVIQCDQRATVSFAVSFNAFSSDPSLLLTRLGGMGGWAQLQCSILNLTTTYARISVFNNNSENISSQTRYLWQAIGKWK